jgi:cobalt/nickel transport system permease protein
MTFEQFSIGNSFFHQADPRSKLVSAGLLSLVISLAQNLRTALAGLILAILLITAARLPWAKVLRRLFVVNGLNAFLLVILPLTYGGTQFFQIAGFNLSKTGFSLAVLITVKANAIILIFISLLSTSTVAKLGQGLQGLLLSPRLCLLLLFSYRYLGLIHEEYLRLLRAAELRSFQPKTTLHTYKTYAYLLGMVIVRSWNRAARVQQAMMLRGFTGTFHSLETAVLRRSDILLAVGLFLATLGLTVLELTR